MAKRTTKTAKKPTKKPAKKTERRRLRPDLWIKRWTLRVVCAVFLLAVFLVVLWGVFNPPTTFYMMQESRRLGGVEHTWVDLEQIAPIVPRAAVASEDANFCIHWGLDVGAIRKAIDDGSRRGASTISQQVAKNVFLWQGRSYVRKVLEAGMTLIMEAIWAKRRILEVYLNVAEFDEGVFGIEAAAQDYFGVNAASLTPTQAARLIAILPSPKKRSASNPSNFVRSRARQILGGAATIEKDGRAGCFES